MATITVTYSVSDHSIQEVIERAVEDGELTLDDIQSVDSVDV